MQVLMPLTFTPHDQVTVFTEGTVEVDSVVEQPDIMLPAVTWQVAPVLAYTFPTPSALPVTGTLAPAVGVTKREEVPSTLTCTGDDTPLRSTVEEPSKEAFTGPLKAPWTWTSEVPSVLIVIGWEVVSCDRNTFESPSVSTDRAEEGVKPGETTTVATPSVEMEAKAVAGIMMITSTGLEVENDWLFPT